MGRQKAKGKRQKAKAGIGLLITFAFCLAFSACSKGPGEPLPADASVGYCPVCKMKVKTEDLWAAEMIYRDGTKLMFESPADMLAFRSDPDRYTVTAAQKDLANVDRILVKDYNTRTQIDARQAKLVYKSKVNGPMGPDLVAFLSHDEATAFAGVNGGTVVALSEVTPEMVKDLRK
jgi:nitrous oxide reductase accessory protein NosL